MKKYLLILSIFITASLAHSQQYQLNLSKSELGWTGKAAFSSYSLSGTIGAKSGSLYREGGRIQEASLVIDMQSIQSDIAQLETHLHSADFFEVERFPEAVFTLRQPIALEAEEEMAGGTLSIKGASRQEKVPLQARQQGSNLILEGRVMVDRTAYGIYYNSPNFFEGLKQEAIADTFELSFKLVFEQGEAE